MHLRHLIPILLSSAVLLAVLSVGSHLGNGLVMGKYFATFATVLVGSIGTLLCQSKPKIKLLDVLIVVFYSYAMLCAISTALVIQNLFVLVCYLNFRMALQQHPKAPQILVGVYLASVAVVLVWAFAQLYGYRVSQHGLFKLTASFFNPGPLAGYLAVALPLGLHHVLHSKPNLVTPITWTYILQMAYWALACFCVLGIVMLLPATRSRIACVAAVCGSAWMLGTHYQLQKMIGKFKKTQIVAAVCALLAVLIVGGMGIYTAKKDSADGRKLIWTITAQHLPQHWLLGSGGGTFSGVYADAQIDYFKHQHQNKDAIPDQLSQQERVAGNPEYAFNDYLQIVSELGLLGLLLFLACIAAGCTYALCATEDGGTKNPHQQAYMAGLLALLLFASASYPFNIVSFQIIFVMLLALLANNDRQIATPTSHTAVLVPLLCVLTLSACIPYQIKAYKAFTAWGNFRWSVPKASVYQQYYPWLKYQATFVFEYGKALQTEKQYANSSAILYHGTSFHADPMFYNLIGKNYQAETAYAKAETAYWQAAYMVPHRLYPYYLLAKLYAESHQTAKAKDMAQYVIDKKVKVDSPAVREMKTEARNILNNTP